MLHDQLLAMDLGMSDDGVIQIGAASAQQKKGTADGNLYQPDDFSQRLWYPDIVFRKVFQEENETQLTEKQFGNDFHLLMSVCHSASEVDACMMELSKAGMIEQKNIDRLKQCAEAFWAKMEEGNYLLGIEKTLNEQVLIAGENEAKKPDKVFVKSSEIIVIDFKTGKTDQKHMEQIVGYAKLLEEIFQKPVRSLLYYSALNQLTEL